MKVCPVCARDIVGADWDCTACGWRAEIRDGVAVLGGGEKPEVGGYVPEIFHRLAEREAGHFWHVARNRLLLWAVGRHAPAARNFLEIGCGTGFVLAGLARAFPDLALTGSELFPEGLAFAARRVPRAAFLQLDARHLPFREEFDAAGLFDVLEHIEEDRLVLENVARACHLGGVVFITVPQHPWLWTVVDEQSCHVRRYLRDDLQEKLRGAGLEPIWTGSFVSLLFPALVLSRLSRQRRQADFDPAEEFDLPRWKHRLLLAALDLERAMIRAGVRFPVGGSLLVVARRQR